MKRINIAATAIMLSAILASCSSEEPVGIWEPMKWKTEVKTVKEDGKTFTEVPAEGGTYEYTCKNYSSMWLYNVFEAKKFDDHFSTDTKVYENSGQKKHFDCPVAKVDIDEAHLTVTIKPNTTGKRRFIEMEVSVGDTGNTFKYRQE